MKKFTYGVLFLAIVGIVLVSCKKEIDETRLQMNQKTLNYNVQVINGILVFETVEDYEKTIDDLIELGDENFHLWEEGLNFTSLRSIKTNDELEEMSFSDPLLASLVNPNAIIEIEGVVYKLSLEEEKVYSIPSEFFEDENSFFNTSNIIEYSIDDEILYPEKKENITNNKSICQSQNTNWHTWNCSGGNVQFRNRYFKSGVYFSLVARIEPNGPGVNGLVSTMNCSWTNSKGNSTFNGSSELTKNHHNFRPYWSTRSLSKFHFQADYYFLDYSSNTSFAPSLTISCN